MPKQRSKFFTFVFSFFPGAGHMFMGFMKMGLSLMGGFFLIMFLSSWLDIGPLIYLMPILVFYSVFDCINKNCAAPEEFANFVDHYLFSTELLSGATGFFGGKWRLIAGVIIAFIGCEILLRNIADGLGGIIPELYMNLFSFADRTLPQIVVSAAIIAFGVYLIIGKKRSEIDDKK